MEVFSLNDFFLLLIPSSCPNYILFYNSLQDMAKFLYKKYFLGGIKCKPKKYGCEEVREM